MHCLRNISLLFLCVLGACTQDAVPMNEEWFEDYKEVVPLFDIPVWSGNDGALFVKLMQVKEATQLSSLVRFRDTMRMWHSLHSSIGEFSYADFQMLSYPIDSSYWWLQGGLIKDIVLYIELGQTDSMNVRNTFTDVCADITERMGDPIWQNTLQTFPTNNALTEEEFPFFRASELAVTKENECLVRDSLSSLFIWKSGDSTNLWAVSCAMICSNGGGLSVRVNLHAVRGNSFELLPPRYVKRLREFSGALDIGMDFGHALFSPCDSVLEPKEERIVEPGNGFPSYLYHKRKLLTVYNDVASKNDLGLSNGYLAYAIDTLEYTLGKHPTPFEKYRALYGSYYIRGIGFVLDSNESVNSGYAIYFTRILEIRDIYDAECP